MSNDDKQAHSSTLVTLDLLYTTSRFIVESIPALDDAADKLRAAKSIANVLNLVAYKSRLVDEVAEAATAIPALCDTIENALAEAERLLVSVNEMAEAFNNASQGFSQDP
jgi:hypothetical protein